MEKLKFLAIKKNCKAKHKSAFFRTDLKNIFHGVSDDVCAETVEKRRGISEIFRGVLKPLQAKRRRNGRKTIFKIGSDHAKKHSTAFKFWLIALIPFLFFIYNHMRKKKKVAKQKDSLVIGVAVYTFFTVIALIFVSIILGQNAVIAEGFGSFKKPEPKVKVVNQPLSFNQIVNQAGDYIQNNIKKIAAANNAGDGGSTVDSVNVINFNRALVFYHENSDQYLAEMVFSDKDGRVSVDRFILKMKNGTDYSHGIYGQD